MKALLYSLTLLLFSLSVEAGDRSQIASAQPVTVDAVLLQTMPEAATPTEFDTGVPPRVLAEAETVCWPQPALPLARQYRPVAARYRSIRAPPAQLT